MLEIQNNDKEMREILSDQTNRLILESIITTPKSTTQLCAECNIPTSTAYRKIQKLSEQKLILKIGTINESGKREAMYKCNLFVLKKILK